MEKPKPFTRTYLDYGQIIDYIEHTYNIKTRGYTPKNGFTKEQLEEASKNWDKKPHFDFWHWMVENSEISNGSSTYIDPKWCISDKRTPDWVKEICVLIADEFPDIAEYRILTEW